MEFTHFKTATQFGRVGANAKLAQRMALYRKVATRALAELASERGVTTEELLETLIARPYRRSDRAESSVEVLVIGAGMAGISAARVLTDMGRRVIVLEARSRIGGRIDTDRSFGFPVEMGAAWIHKADGNPLTALADRFSPRRFSTDYDSLALYDGGKRIGLTEALRSYEVERKALKELEDHRADLQNDQSVAATLARLDTERGLSDQERKVLRWRYFWDVEMDLGLGLDQLSTLWFEADDEFRGEDQILLNGYDRIVKGLADGLDVRLQHVVSVVDHGGGAVRVTTDQGIFEAAQCVVTAPLGVLKTGAIQFEPALPENVRRAITNLGFGAYHKLALQFKRQFWDDADFVGYMSPSGEHVELLNVAHFSGHPVLLMSSGQDYARSLSGLTPEEAAKRAMIDLRTAYGGDVPDPTDVLASEWVDSPYTKGSYTYWAVGSGPDDNRAFESDIGGKLFFAGEHTSAKYLGTVHGAYLSGLAAADRIGLSSHRSLAAQRSYERSPAERRVDFAAVKGVLDDERYRVDLALRTPIRKVLDDLIELIKRRDEAGGITDSFVMGLTLTTGPETQRILGDYLLKIWKRGRELAANELPEKLRGKIKKFAGLEPVQAINFFQNLRPWLVKGIIDDDLKRAARLELTEHLKGGRTLTETIGNLRDAWEPFIGDPTKVIPSGISGTPEDILQASRLENIVRTEAITALSQGRAEIADEAGDFVIGYGLSPILDQRTSPPCLRIGELEDAGRPVQFRKDDPRSDKLMPALHYQCRTIPVFITTDDLPVRWSTEAELDSVLRLVPEGFK